jgi:hypothetical protein
MAAGVPGEASAFLFGGLTASLRERTMDPRLEHSLMSDYCADGFLFIRRLFRRLLPLRPVLPYRYAASVSSGLNLGDPSVALMTPSSRKRVDSFDVTGSVSNRVAPFYSEEMVYRGLTP